MAGSSRDPGPTLTRSEVLERLSAAGIRPSRALGQNFVVDPNTIRRIVRLSEVEPTSSVVEVGAGVGSLTVALAAAARQVVAIEVDRRLLPVLDEVIDAHRRSSPPVTVVAADALRVDWNELLSGAARWVLVANLPYNVATQLVVQVLEQAPAVRSMVVMVQREVGERMAAGPGSRAYGAVSVKVAYWATASVVGRVPPTVFVPRPKVESVLVRFVRREEPAVPETTATYERLSEVVRAGFAHRRKMLRRALAEVVAVEAFAAAGVSPELRAEDIGIQEWGRLAGWR